MSKVYLLRTECEYLGTAETRDFQMKYAAGTEWAFLCSVKKLIIWKYILFFGIQSRNLLVTVEHFGAVNQIMVPILIRTCRLAKHLLYDALFPPHYFQHLFSIPIRHFIDDPTKPEWLLRMPMTKAAVRAMDVVTDFVKKEVGRDLSQYCVGGASKVTWAIKHKQT